MTSWLLGYTLMPPQMPPQQWSEALAEHLARLDGWRIDPAYHVVDLLFGCPRVRLREILARMERAFAS